MKILIIDDEEKIRQVIKEYCEAENYECFEADNGITALDLLKKNNYDLLVLDIMMPKMDGYELTKEIRDAVVLMLRYYLVKLTKQVYSI